jgi:Trk K+ transport system NAD-binding subunit
VAIAVIGLRTGLIDAATSTFIILFALITVLLMPLIFNVLAPVVEQARRRFMLVMGVTDLSLAVAQELRAHGDAVRFVEDEPLLAGRAGNSGFEVLATPATAAGVRAIDLSGSDSVLLLGEHDEQNLELAREVRALTAANVVVQVNDPQNLPVFEELGAQPFMIAALRATMVALLARNPDAFQLLTSTTDERAVAEVHVQNRSLIGVQVRDLRLPGDYLLLSIRRDGNLLVPHGSTALEMGDRLTVLGSEESMPDIKAWLAGGTPPWSGHTPL